MIRSALLTEPLKAMPDWETAADKHSSGLSTPSRNRDSASDQKPATGLAKKWRLFRQAVMNAGERIEKMSWRERLKGQLLSYPKGQIIGFFKGLKRGAFLILNPKSALHKFSLSKLPEDLPVWGEDLLDFGTEFANADWEKQGKMSGAAIVPGALMFLMLRNAVPGDVGKMLKGLLK